MQIAGQVLPDWRNDRFLRHNDRMDGLMTSVIAVALIHLTFGVIYADR